MTYDSRVCFPHQNYETYYNTRKNKNPYTGCPKKNNFTHMENKDRYGYAAFFGTLCIWIFVLSCIVIGFIILVGETYPRVISHNYIM